MRLPRDPFDRRAQDTAIADALRNTEQTAVYLDTSSLVWMYRLAVGARTEFIDWSTSGAREGKVHIPAWALHELHKHRRSMDTLFPARPKVKVVETELKFLREAASLFVDDALAAAKSFSDRNEYLEFFDKASKNVARSLALLRDVEVGKVEAQLIPFFESASLSLPLPEFGSIHREFLARSEGRVPPGYHDASKKGADGKLGGEGANRYGDFAIWREILTHASKDEALRKIVIITHDQKNDWVYVPERFLDYDGKVAPNNSNPKVVTCPHPMLGHEAKTVAGIDELYIVTIPQLIQLLSTHGAAREVQQLARAVQIEQEAEEERATRTEADAISEIAVDAEPRLEPEVEDAEQIEAVEAPQEPNEVPAEEPQPEMALVALLDALAHEALADAEYEAVGAEGTPDHIIRALKSYNWYRQNPVVPAVPGAILDESSTNEQIFVLGRNVYQAACGNSNSSVQLVENLENFVRRIPSPKGEIFFAGLVFEAYFDSHGQIRDRPKGEHLKPLFIVAGAARFAEVVRWFRGRVGDDEQKFIRLPGDGPPADGFNILEQNGRVTDIQLRGMSLVNEADPDFEWIALPENATERELKRQIADHFATLEGYVLLVPHMPEARDLSHLKFIEWGTSTNVTFPPR